MFNYNNNFKNNPISILIIDDDKNHNKIFKNLLLEEKFYPIEIVAERKFIIKSIKSFNPDIIVMGLDFNIKHNNIANDIWFKFTIATIFIVNKYHELRYKKSLFCEPYGFLLRPINKFQAKMSIETAYHKHILIENFLKKVRKEKSSFIDLKGGFKFDNVQLILYKEDRKIELTKNEKKLLFITSSFMFKVTPINIIYNFIYRDDLYELNKLRTIIYRLRKKLDFDIFETYANDGYRLKIIKY